MSGVECIGAILGIAGSGIQIAATLYDFSSSVSSAKEDMRTIAESIDTYSSVLETLGRQLEVSQAVCSSEGLRLAQDLERQSEALFKKIAEHIPASTENVSMRQKVTWFFQKDRVSFLVGQIEQLKATVSLLLQILILAQTTKPRTQTNNVVNQTQNVTNNVNINVNVINAEINSQFRRAENRVMQYHNASVKFAKLQLEEEEPVVRNALPWQEDFEELPVVRQTKNDDDDIAASFGLLALRQPRISMDDTNANSTQLVGMLLDHWTTVETHEQSSTTTTTTSSYEMEEPVQSIHTKSNPKTSSAINESDIDPISRAETVPDLAEHDTPTTRANTTSEAVPTSTSTSTASSNMLKGWWTKYRQSQKTTREEDERRKQLDQQENELKRRETQLQREQTLVDRELKLQEAEKHKAEAQAKALAERERRLAESSRLDEAKHKQALAEKEARAQTEMRLKSERKDHLARLRELRHHKPQRQPSTQSTTSLAENPTKPAEEDSQSKSLVPVSPPGPDRDINTDLDTSTNTNTITNADTNVKVNKTNSRPRILDHARSRSSNLALNTLVSSHFSETAKPKTPAGTTHTARETASDDSSPSSPSLHSSHSLHSVPSLLDSTASLDRVSSAVMKSKEARKKRREEWKQARRDAKAARSKGL